MGVPGPKRRTKEITWTADIAYGVGLMASDGCLSSDGRHLIFVSKDLEQVLNIKRIFSVRANIGFLRSGTGSHYHRLQWGDVTLYEFLLVAGLMSNKSLVLGKIYLPDLFFFDYLRGSLDGDGCFYSYFDPRWKSSYMFYLALASGSRLHLEWVQSMTVKFIGVAGHITTHKHKNKINPFYQLKFAKKDSFAVLSRIYPNNRVTCLSRKRLKIETALGIVGLSLPGDT